MLPVNPSLAPGRSDYQNPKKETRKGLTRDPFGPWMKAKKKGRKLKFSNQLDPD